jgi:hypothetical protein
MKMIGKTLSVGGKDMQRKIVASRAEIRIVLYFPADDEDFEDVLLNTPKIPMLVDSPHVTRRIAAQRSRFIIFGTDPEWLSDQFRKPNSRLGSIRIPGARTSRIRQELRDAGITESVAFIIATNPVSFSTPQDFRSPDFHRRISHVGTGFIPDQAFGGFPKRVP